MTENEIKMIEKISNLSGDYKCYDNTISHEESLILDRLLTEIQQYRALGTVEELKTFKDGFAVDFANMGYEKGLRDGYSKAEAYYKNQMKGGE